MNAATGLEPAALASAEVRETLEREVKLRVAAEGLVLPPPAWKLDGAGRKAARAA